jgi:hypothetical protein
MDRIATKASMPPREPSGRTSYYILCFSLVGYGNWGWGSQNPQGSNLANQLSQDEHHHTTVLVMHKSKKL